MPSHTSLSAKALSGAKWSYAGNTTRAISQFVIGILLARLLGPTAYGTIAIAWIIVGLGKLVADFGLGAALIQQQNPSDRDIGFVFAFQLAMGCVLTISCWMGAPYIAHFFSEPTAGPVIKVMSLTFLLQAAAQVSVSLLTREFRFKVLQLAGISTYLFGYLGLGLPLALQGAGVWSLVVAQMGQAILFTGVVTWLCRARLSICLRPTTPGILVFGKKIIGANVASWALLNVDNLFVGRAFGANDLGLYNRSMTLVATPTGTLAASAQPVLFAACSRLSTKSDRIENVYLGVTGALGLAVIPVFAVIAAIPETVVSAVYGDEWIAASPILTPLALAMPVYALLAVVGPVLMAINRVELELRAQWMALAITVPMLAIAATQSLIVLAWTVLMSYSIRLVLLVFALQRGINLSWNRWARTIAPAFIFALIVVVPTFLADRAYPWAEPELRLGADVLIAGALSVLAMRLIGPLVQQTPIGNLLSDQFSLPLALRNWLRFQG